MIKSIALAYRKAGMTREEYNKYWLEQHGPMAARMIPGLRKYVQNHFITIPGREYKGDGFVEMWYDDVQAFKKSMEYLQSEEGKDTTAASIIAGVKAAVREWADRMKLNG